MYIKLDYFNFAAFDLEVKATEIFKYILSFFGEETSSASSDNLSRFFANFLWVACLRPLE